MTHLVDTLSTEKGVELGLTLLGGLEEGSGVGNLDGRVAESLAESRESLEVGGQDLSADLGLVVLNERENVLGAQEELVEALVGRKEDLDELIGRLRSDLVGNEREETSEELDLGLVGGLGGHGVLVVLVDGGGNIVVGDARVVELLGGDLRGNPGGEGGGGDEDVNASCRRVQNEGAGGRGTAEEGRHAGRLDLRQSQTCG